MRGRDLDPLLCWAVILLGIGFVAGLFFAAWLFPAVVLSDCTHWR